MQRYTTFKSRFQRLVLAVRYWVQGATWEEADHVARSVVYGWNWGRGDDE